MKLTKDLKKLSKEDFINIIKDYDLKIKELEKNQISIDNKLKSSVYYLQIQNNKKLELIKQALNKSNNNFRVRLSNKIKKCEKDINDFKDIINNKLKVIPNLKEFRKLFKV